MFFQCLTVNLCCQSAVFCKVDRLVEVCTFPVCAECKAHLIISFSEWTNNDFEIGLQMCANASIICILQLILLRLERLRKAMDSNCIMYLYFWSC